MNTTSLIVIVSTILTFLICGWASLFWQLLYIKNTIKDKINYKIPILYKRSNSYLPLLPIKFNGKDYYFVIDSGAGDSYIDINFVREKTLCEIEESTISVVGIGGMSDNKTFIVKDFTFKSSKIEFTSNFISTDLGPALNPINNNLKDRGCIGLLGADFLHKYHIKVDVKNEILFIPRKDDKTNIQSK